MSQKTDPAPRTDTIKRPPRMSPGEKAKQNPRNIKFAVAAHCYHDCQGEEATNSHTTKFAIKNCANKDCFLWPFRGWQKVTGGTTRPRS